ncbi:MAG: hypothetical protein GX335_07635 [Firmicutes bacterium]|nr:hypothetical protein [Bacillota bacterium]
MKKPFVFCGALFIVFLLAFNAMAISLDGDLSYVLGQSDGFTGGSHKMGGFLVNADVEIFPQVLADGFFLSSDSSGEGEEKFSVQILAGGAKYRLDIDSELDVFLGAGWSNFEIKSESNPNSGSGFYGKLGLKFEFDPQIRLVGDLNYAPKFRFEDQNGTFLSGRATLSYDVFEGIGIQGTIGRYRANADKSLSGTFYGGGVTFKF